MDAIRFVRLVRTSGSESFVLFSKEKRIGALGVHYSNVTHADLVIEGEVIDDDLNDICNSVYQMVETASAEDVILTIWDGEERAYISGDIDHETLPPTRADLKKLHKEIASHVGRHRKVVGHLNEQVAREYFEAKGYVVVKGTSQQDHEKIDLVAVNEKRVLPIQVKSGEITLKQIKKYIEPMKNAKEIGKYVAEGKELIVTFAAKTFPPNANIERIDLEEEFGCRIMFIGRDDILSVLPQYKHALGG